MNDKQEPSSLEELFERVREAPDDEGRVSLDAILDVVGRRSFGPVLLVAGLITVAPIIGDIPGVPGIMGILVMLVAGQVLFRHEHFWLPAWVLRRSISQEKLCKALGWLQRPARFIDRLLRPRLTVLTRPLGAYVIAFVCLQIALIMPFMEVVPFSANAAGLVLTAFGLALIACDGVLALIAYATLVLSLGIAAYALL